MFIHEQFAVGQVGIELGDVGLGVGDVGCRAEVVGVIEENVLVVGGVGRAHSRNPAARRRGLRPCPTARADQGACRARRCAWGSVRAERAVLETYGVGLACC